MNNITENKFSPAVQAIYETIQTLDPLFKPTSSFHITEKAKELGVEVERDFTGAVKGHRVLSFGRARERVRPVQWKDSSDDIFRVRHRNSTPSKESLDAERIT